MNDASFTDLEMSNLAGAVKISPWQGLPGEILRVLMISYPNKIAAKSLMVYLGGGDLDQSGQHKTFVRLLNIMIFINEQICRFGFKVERSNGTIDGRYWLKRTR